jgi:hypothetical protein
MEGLPAHGRLLATDRMENASNLVLGMGVGTFIVFFFAILLFFVFVFTGPCTKVEKIVWRSVTFAIFGIIILILIFAEKETQFYYTTVTPSAYDYKIIPRIAIGCVAILFGIISGIFIIEHTGETRELSTVDHEPTALWQH